jgi:hypothetical protein
MLHRNSDAREAINLHLQAAAEQTQQQVFFLMANVAAYDPATNSIKAVIANYTNDSEGQCMQTGWVKLNTPWNGMNFGMQVGPYGGGTIDNPTGDAEGGGEQEVFPEQVVLLVIGRESTFYVAGAFLFNNILTPPGNAETLTDDFGNVQRTQFVSGECIIRHSSGSYIYLKQDGSINVVANTSPQKPFKEPSETSLERDLHMGVIVNSDDQVEEPTDVTAGILLDSVIGVQTGSIPDGTTATNAVAINADTTGGMDITSSIDIQSNPVTADDGVTGTCSSTVSSIAVGKALDATGEADLGANVEGKANTDNTANVKAQSSGEGINTSAVNLQAKSDTGSDNGANFELSAICADGGTNDSLGEITVGATGGESTAELDITSTAEDSALLDIICASETLATLDIAATGSADASINLASDGMITADAATIITITAGGDITITSPVSVTVLAPLVDLGDGAGTNVLNQVSAAVYNGHTHNDPQGGVTGAPNQPITPAESALNVYAS